jgi:PAS domain S-box-containing protein
VGYWAAQLLWTGGYIGELLSPSLAGKLAWDSFQFFGYFAITPSVVLMAAHYAGKNPIDRRRFWLKWSVLPCIVTGAAFTDPLHHWMRASAHIVPAPPAGALWYDFTFLDYLGLAYGYYGHAYAVGILVRHVRRASPVARRQAFALALGVVTPVLMGTLVEFVYNPFPQRDSAPFSMLLGGFILSWGLFRSRFFELLPVARDVVFESVADGVVVIDQHDLVVDINPAALSVLQTSTAASIGKPLREVLGSLSIEMPRLSGADAHKAVGCRIGERWFEIVQRELSDAATHRRGVVVVFHDVTAARQRELELERSRELLEQKVLERTVGLSEEIEQRKQAELALARSERKFRAIFERSFQLVGITTPDGRLLEANESALNLVGATAEEVINQPYWETPWWTHSETVVNRLKSAISSASRGEFVRFETTHRARDGSTRYIDFSLTPVTNEHGEVSLLIPEGRDITELKRSEDERRLLEARLHQAQRLEALGKFAGGIAHDFNNILTVIAGNIAMLQATCAEHEDAEALRDALDASQRAAALTRQLLTFSRGQVIEPRVFDPVHALRGLRNLLTRVLREDIVLRCDLPDLPASVFMDPSQFEQVIVNLAVNARDAMPNGGTLEIRVARVAAGDVPGVAATQTPRGWLRISVEDTGVGIAEADLAHLFEPFFTTKAPTQSSGTGLGLATVQAIVTRAGGTIRVTTRVNEGTRFDVCLPMADLEHAPVTVAPEPPSSSRPGATILVVEDQAKVREYVARALQKFGYRTICFGKATEALAYVRVHPQAIDVVLTDLVMPEVSGAKLVEALLEMLPTLPIVLMSGHIDQVTLERIGQFTHAAFLAKPFSPETLVEKINSALRTASLAPTPH